MTYISALTEMLTRYYISAQCNGNHVFTCELGAALQRVTQLNQDVYSRDPDV